MSILMRNTRRARELAYAAAFANGAADGRPTDHKAPEVCWGSVVVESLDLAAAWKERDTDVGPLAGKTVRLRFVVRDADLFSYQFQPK
ncbi:MAG: hypothetical protein QGG36_00050 [Pirellulaceae bacterium]|jgi:hypothetical protein|nr:hypothetical protein [Pirellulaceae bacterium]MDP7014166.1 hypothetical protein [Pirellulaceae bacterium]